MRNKGKMWLFLLCLLFLGCDSRVCVKKHEEPCRKTRIISFIYVAKVMIPIYGSYDSTCEVCDEYAHDKGGKE